MNRPDSDQKGMECSSILKVERLDVEHGKGLMVDLVVDQSKCAVEDYVASMIEVTSISATSHCSAKATGSIVKRDCKMSSSEGEKIDLITQLWRQR